MISCGGQREDRRPRTDSQFPGGGRTHVAVLDDVDVEAAVGRLELEVGDGVVELDVGEALADGLVDLGALVALVARVAQVHLERVGRGVAVVERDGDAAPEVVALAVRDEELFALGAVAEVHAEVEDPGALELVADHGLVLRRGHGERVGGGVGGGGA